MTSLSLLQPDERIYKDFLAHATTYVHLLAWKNDIKFVLSLFSFEKRQCIIEFL